MQAAYPDVRVRWRDVWGGYMVGYAVNNVFPLGGGNVAQLFLTRSAIPSASYPAWPRRCRQAWCSIGPWGCW